MENPQEVIIIKEYQKAMRQLNGLWDEIGIEMPNREARSSYVTEELKRLLGNIVAQESCLKKKILLDIEKFGQQFYNLNKDLEAGKSDPDDNFTLLELENYLRQNVETLMKEVKKRQEHLKDLQLKEQALCERLIEEPTDLPRRTVPQKEDIDLLEKKIRTLEQEKANREKTFFQLQKRISEIMDELEQRANNSFERDALSDVELFTLSQQNLQRMKGVKEEYESKVKSNEIECKNMREQITLLCNRLEVDPLERENFLSTVKGHRPTAIRKLSEELQHLKEKQQQDIAKYINKLRREIESWWEKCYISDEQKNEFFPYFTDDYSEEVLVAHDAEVQKLVQLYNESKSLFSKVEKRKEVWLKFMGLEERATNPSRLFENRGCSLLQEEKERKRVKKELPIIEKELETLVQAWESVHGKSFLIEGRTVTDYIEHEWVQYHERKEQERKKKLSERQSQLNYESRMGSKPPAVKRRMATNDNLRKSKLLRINEDQPSVISYSRKNPLHRTALRERNQNSIREGSEQSGSEISTYSRFASGLIHKKRNQSTFNAEDSTAVPSITSQHNCQ